jgi:hypothetical protein
MVENKEQNQSIETKTCGQVLTIVANVNDVNSKFSEQECEILINGRKIVFPEDDKMESVELAHILPALLWICKRITF